MKAQKRSIPGHAFKRGQQVTIEGKTRVVTRTAKDAVWYRDIGFWEQVAGIVLRVVSSFGKK